MSNDFLEHAVPVVGPRGAMGPQGVQGIQGIQGEIGPVGPVGLTWRGVWDAETAYSEDDAVSWTGPNGITSSYFAIQESTGETPEEGVSNAYWAMLAQEGPRGVQGPQGVQGDGINIITVPEDEWPPASDSDPLNWYVMVPNA